MKAFTLLPILVLLAVAVRSHGQGTLAPEQIELLERQQTLIHTDGAPDDRFGYSIAIEGDTLMAGAAHLNSGQGAVFVYGKTGPHQWTQLQMLTAPDGKTYDLFGTTLALSGDTLVVGAPGNSDKGAWTGTAYVFEKSGATWTYKQRVNPTNRANFQTFGWAVAVDGVRIIVGARGDSTTPQKPVAGAVYFFGKSGSTWTESFKLVPTDAREQDAFGLSIALSGTNLLVGARCFWTGPANAPTPLDAGAVYLFGLSGSTWRQLRKLAPSDLSMSDAFGDGLSGIALGKDSIMVGAPGDDHPQVGSDAGMVYVFDKLSGAERQRLTARDAVPGGGFGSALATDGDTLAVAGSGSVYLFAKLATGWTEVAKLTPTASENSFAEVDIQGDEIIAGSPSMASASVFAPGYGNPSNVASYIRKRLYLADAAASPFANPGTIAFLYKYKLYGPVSNQTDIIQRQFEHLSAYYGDAQRRQIRDALVELRLGLARNPESDILGHLLLDVYYDQTVAETIYARELLQKAELARFGGGSLTLADPPPPGKFIIENEIAAYRLALSSNSVVLANYMGLLRDPVECRLFQRLAPERGLAPATYLRTNEHGVVFEAPVTESEPLYDRFKDLALVYELLGDHGQAAAALARLHTAQGNSEASRDTISRTKRFLALHNALLLGLFDLQVSTDDPSRVAQAIARMNNSLADLDLVGKTQRGQVNLLGFADDFLMFVQPKSADGAASASTFDTLRTFLNPTLPGENPLSFALKELDILEENYARYRDSQDELAEQFSDSSITYSDRLRDIVGVFPGNPTYGDVPTAHRGSELDQQLTSIDLARNRIFGNSTRIENLKQQVEIELNKAAWISNVMVDFGNQRAFATEVIGHISAAQAGLNAGASAFASVEKLATGLFVYDLVNAQAQSLGEEGKAQLEAEKERLSALEQATIVNLETDALVKTLLLDMNVLLVDSQEAALTLRQEIHRLEGLVREKKQLEDRLALRDLRLARRYFADPVHRLSVQSYVIRANQAFESAQRWLFYLVRALEYKWNEDFGNYPYANRYWSSQSIFRLRNALELKDYFMAMLEYDAPKDNTTPWGSAGWDYFSLRDDQFSCASVGEFRERLRQAVDKTSQQRLIVLHFNTASTVRNLFLGATFDVDGHLDEERKGTFLDRIMEMRIRIAGRDSLKMNEVPQVSLTYGGTSLIRNRAVGKYDPNRADRLRNEFTSYSTRFYQFDGPNFDDYLTVEALSAQALSAKLGETTGTSPDVKPIIEFAERSVAATDWTLKIPTQDSNARPYFLIDDVEDIEIWFRHRGASRTK